MKYQDWEKLDKVSSKIEVYIPSGLDDKNDYLSSIQSAIIHKNIIEIGYVDNNCNQTQRKIEPIGIIFYTNQWHLIAWCWLRNAYRDFKVEKINQLVLTSEVSGKEHTFTVQDYMKIF